MDTPLPTLFLSHGSPMLAIDDSPAGRFLDSLGETLPTPKAIVIASAHFTAPVPVAGADARPRTVHDFGRFAEELLRMRYEVPGDPALAHRIRPCGIFTSHMRWGRSRWMHSRSTRAGLRARSGAVVAAAVACRRAGIRLIQQEDRGRAAFFTAELRGLPRCRDRGIVSRPYARVFVMAVATPTRSFRIHLAALKSKRSDAGASGIAGVDRGGRMSASLATRTRPPRITSRTVPARNRTGHWRERSRGAAACI
jgi:hypothetical protein